MFESFNYEREKIRTADQNLRTYTDSVKKDHLAYLEKNTLHFENVADITVNSDGIIPEKKRNRREGDHQKNCKIPFDENEANKSIIASKTILQDIQLYLTFISKLTSKIYQYHH